MTWSGVSAARRTAGTDGSRVGVKSTSAALEARGDGKVAAAVAQLGGRRVFSTQLETSRCLTASLLHRFLAAAFCPPVRAAALDRRSRRKQRFGCVTDQTRRQRHCRCPAYRETVGRGPWRCLARRLRRALRLHPAATSHRITESQNGRGWKGPLWVTQSNPPAEAGSPRAGCTGPCPGWS